MYSPKNQYICRLLNPLLKLLLYVPQREMVRVQHDVFIDLPPESQLLSKHPLHVNTHTHTLTGIIAKWKSNCVGHQFETITNEREAACVRCVYAVYVRSSPLLLREKVDENPHITHRYALTPNECEEMERASNAMLRSSGLSSTIDCWFIYFCFPRLQPASQSPRGKYQL